MPFLIKHSDSSIKVLKVKYGFWPQSLLPALGHLLDPDGIVCKETSAWLHFSGRKSLSIFYVQSIGGKDKDIDNWQWKPLTADPGTGALSQYIQLKLDQQWRMGCWSAYLQVEHCLQQKMSKNFRCTFLLSRIRMTKSTRITHFILQGKKVFVKNPREEHYVKKRLPA